MFRKFKFISFILFLSLLNGAHLANKPWTKLGLTDEEAARHVLDRFAFGPRQGDIDEVVSLGVGNWFERQLLGSQDDSQLEDIFNKLDFKTVNMSLEEMASTYVPMGQINQKLQKWAVESGLITDKDYSMITNEDRRNLALLYMEEFSLRPIAEYDSEITAQKIVRAAYSENQLQEVLTDFWFNHFNIDASKNQVRPYVYSYERDAIRNNVFGDFREMLESTAKHPGMLFYLDNGLSTAGSNVETTASFHMEKLSNTTRKRDLPKSARKLLGNSGRGLNENYARELMELHTLGVDAFNNVGGYTQEDVQEVARAFTGWTWMLTDSLNTRLPENITLMGNQSNPSDSFLSSQLQRLGFVQEGSFVFRASAHDAGEKNILGNHFGRGGGIEEGEKVLDILSQNEYTARFLSKKIATKFVQDNPPEALIKIMSKAYLESSGNLTEVYRSMFYSDYFWKDEAIRSKIKSPFELAISTIRILDSELTQQKGLLNNITAMGQSIYRYQAPTGYPDSATAWVNTGSLISRMNFGLSIAGNKIRGVSSDLKKLNTFGGVFHEPESVQHALEVYARLLMPYRDLEETLRILEPVINVENLDTKIESASAQFETKRNMSGYMGDQDALTVVEQDFDQGDDRKSRKENASILAQVVGVILGSPEFQRR
tara:strand:- start:4046 stop:6016 length:1971 start_codon:yes stop_codon:yes gene_type:complete